MTIHDNNLSAATTNDKSDPETTAIQLQPAYDLKKHINIGGKKSLLKNILTLYEII